MLKKLRVLVVDDSIAACRLLSDALASDPRIEVAGTAVSGASALAMVPQCSPDLVMLDMDMPGMDGLQTLGELKKIRPRLPVIMCSDLGDKGNTFSVQSLLNGASDYIAKPRTGGCKEPALQAFRRELHAKIHSLLDANPAAARPAEAAAESPAMPGPRATAQERVDIVAIGVSTGGPNALAEVLPRLPANFPVPIVLVQHMPPNFTKSLAQSLAARCRLGVEEGAEGRPLTPGKAWIAPGGFHMVLRRERGQVSLSMNLEPAVNSCRPSVDVLFESVANIYGPNALGIVLTGMGQDGLRGAGALRRAGSAVYVQDEASSIIWGMPGAVAKAGLASRIVRLADMADVIVGTVLQSRNRPQSTDKQPPTGRK